MDSAPFPARKASVLGGQECQIKIQCEQVSWGGCEGALPAVTPQARKIQQKIMAESLPHQAYNLYSDTSKTRKGVGGSDTQEDPAMCPSLRGLTAAILGAFTWE